LAVLIDELLKVSRLSRQDLHRSALDLTALARTVAARIVENNDCPFEVQEGLKVFADETTVQLLLENLIGNAFKFSPNGGRVSMGQINVDGESAFYVKDEGIGFDMQYVHKIFLPFERLVTDSEYDGTGIGLSNVKRIAERHGGKVWCESALGEGATFFFTLSS
jgi:light-regulated signal transduction histidine kinase (bacteriophytochrome)